MNNKRKRKKNKKIEKNKNKKINLDTMLKKKIVSIECVLVSTLAPFKVKKSGTS
jgi:hypothetical protein